METVGLADFMRQYRADRDALEPVQIEVYVCFDAAEAVLYVGRMDCFARRWRRHSRRLRQETKRVAHFYHESFGDSLVAEAVLICEHQPPFNRVGVDR